LSGTPTKTPLPMVSERSTEPGAKKRRRTTDAELKPMEDCRIVAIAGPIQPRRQRRMNSHFVYQLEWDHQTTQEVERWDNRHSPDTRERSWTRLLHLEHAEVEADDGSTQPRDFASEPSDHAETPMNAYSHVRGILKHIQDQKTKMDSDKYFHRTLRIYDPYFCQGAVVTKLGEMGFFSVYNRNENFYASDAWKLVMGRSERGDRVTSPRPENEGEDTAPSQHLHFDVLLTNPPYSGDHVDKLFQFSIRSRRPFLLLVPNTFLATAGYISAFANEEVFLLGPRKRYVYRSPPELRSRQDKSLALGTTKKKLNQRLKYVAVSCSQRRSRRRCVFGGVW